MPQFWTNWQRCGGLSCKCMYKWYMHTSSNIHTLHKLQMVHQSSWNILPTPPCSISNFATNTFDRIKVHTLSQWLRHSSYVEAFTISSVFAFEPPMYVPCTHLWVLIKFLSGAELIIFIVLFEPSMAFNLVVSSNFRHPSLLGVMSSSWLGTMSNVLCCQMIKTQQTCGSIRFLPLIGPT